MLAAAGASQHDGLGGLEGGYYGSGDAARGAASPSVWASVEVRPWRPDPLDRMFVWRDRARERGSMTTTRDRRRLFVRERVLLFASAPLL